MSLESQYPWFVAIYKNFLSDQAKVLQMVDFMPLLLPGVKDIFQLTDIFFATSTCFAIFSAWIIRMYFLHPNRAMFPKMLTQGKFLQPSKLSHPVKLHWKQNINGPKVSVDHFYIFRVLRIFFRIIHWKVCSQFEALCSDISW